MIDEEQIFDTSKILAPAKPNTLWDYMQVVGLILVLLFIFFPWLMFIAQGLVWFFTDAVFFHYTFGKMMFSIWWPICWLVFATTIIGS